MIKSLLLLSSLLASTCQTGPFPKPTPQPEPIDPWPDATIADAGPAPVPTPPAPSDGGASAACAAACANRAKLKCKEALPTAKGATCVDVCMNVESSGVISLGPDCVVHATNCDDANACAYSVTRH